MIYSMTGYAQAKFTGDDFALACEITSYNGKYLNLHTRVPDFCNSIAGEIEKRIKDRIIRGTIYYNLKVTSSLIEPSYELNREVIKKYLEQLAAFKTVKVKDEGMLASVLALPGTVKVIQADQDAFLQAITPEILSVTDNALDNLCQMRLQEGKTLYEDLKKRLTTIKELADRVKTMVPQKLQEFNENLRKKVDQLLKESNVSIDEKDVIKEVAFYIERSDFTEEMTRLVSHVEQFDDALEDDGDIGRKLEFLVQEMVRESNTMASKNVDVEIAEILVKLKVEISKVREQIFNIE